MLWQINLAIRAEKGKCTMRKNLVAFILCLVGAAALAFTPLGWIPFFGGIDGFNELSELTGWQWLDRWHYWGAVLTWLLMAVVLYAGWYLLYRKTEPAA